MRVDPQRLARLIGELVAADPRGACRCFELGRRPAAAPVRPVAQPQPLPQLRRSEPPREGGVLQPLLQQPYRRPRQGQRLLAGAALDIVEEHGRVACPLHISQAEVVQAVGNDAGTDPEQQPVAERHRCRREQRGHRLRHPSRIVRGDLPVRSRADLLGRQAHRLRPVVQQRELDVLPCHPAHRQLLPPRRVPQRPPVSGMGFAYGSLSCLGQRLPLPFRVGGQGLPLPAQPRVERPSVHHAPHVRRQDALQVIQAPQQRPVMRLVPVVRAHPVLGQHAPGQAARIPGEAQTVKAAQEVVHAGEAPFDRARGTQSAVRHHQIRQRPQQLLRQHRQHLHPQQALSPRPVEEHTRQPQGLLHHRGRHQTSTL